MVAALRRLGFDKVFDTDFGADLTIVEEANEFVGRGEEWRRAAHDYLLFPGWVKFAEYYYPDQLEHLSTCKSPQQMSGAVIKTYYAEKNGHRSQGYRQCIGHALHGEKFECGRDDQNAAGVPDIDIAITTRELARMIDRAGLVHRPAG